MSNTQIPPGHSVLSRRPQGRILYFPLLQEPESAQKLTAACQRTSPLLLSFLILGREVRGYGGWNLLSSWKEAIQSAVHLASGMNLQAAKGLELDCHLKKVIHISFNIYLPQKKVLAVLTTDQTANSQLTADFRGGHKGNQNYERRNI